MPPTRHALALLLLVLTIPLVAAPVRAQDDAAQEEPPPKAKLSEDDVKKFERLYLEAMDKNDVVSKQALADAMEEYSKKNGVGSVLADEPAWRGMYARRYRESLGKKRARGTGTIKVERIEKQIRGEWVIFEYAYRLPKGYTHDKAWPVLLCIHDAVKSDGDGKSYLKKVWQSSKVAAKLADDFILVAPSLGKKTIKGKIRRERAKEERLDWFNGYHARAMILPLNEIREQFHCNPNKIFVEGVGEGAEAALELGMLYGETFAGVIARHGQPRNMQLLTGLDGVPTMFLYREGGLLDQGERKSFWDDVKSAAEREGIKGFTYKAYPKPEKMTPREKAGQKTDALIQANEDIAKFIAETELAAYPDSIRITTNNRLFTRRGIMRITKHDLHENNVVDCKVSVDKEKNAVHVSGSNFYSFTLFLNDTVLDLDRPVEVYVNEVRAERKVVPRSLDYMLRQMGLATYLVHRVFTAALPVEVPEPAEGGGDGAGSGNGESKATLPVEERATGKKGALDAPSRGR